MVGKRKADDNHAGRRRPAARRDPTAGYDLAGTSANNAGPTGNAAGDGIAGISSDMAWLLEVTSGYAPGPPQFDGVARGAGGGSGYRGFSQSHGRAPQMPSQGMLRPPLANPAARGAGGGSGYRGFSQSQLYRREPQMPSQGMLRPPLANRAVGSAPFPYRPTGNGSLSGQSQITGSWQTGTGQPRGHSGSGGPSPAFSYASNVLPQHPEIRYAPPRPVPSYGGATQGQGIAIGHQPQLDLRLRLGQPSSAAPPRVAVGPHTWGPSARWCRLCPAPATRVFCSAPFCEVCYNRLLAADDVPPQHAQANRPCSSSSSGSTVDSGPVCQACGHLIGRRNRACRFCHHRGPPPPGLG